MQDLLDPLPLYYEFVEAIDAIDLTDAQIEEVYNDRAAIQTMGRSLSKPEIACALSHIKAWKRIKYLGLEEAFIVEDDIMFKDKNAFLEILKRRFDFPSDCEVMLFAHGSSRRMGVGGASSIFHKWSIYEGYKMVRFVRKTWSVLGLWCSRSAVEKLLRATKVLEGTLDDCYTGNDKVVNLYGIEPVIIEEHPVWGDQSLIADQRRFEKDRPKNTFFIALMSGLGLLEYSRRVRRRLGRWFVIFFRSPFVRRYK